MNSDQPDDMVDEGSDERAREGAEGAGRDRNVACRGRVVGVSSGAAPGCVRSVPDRPPRAPIHPPFIPHVVHRAGSGHATAPPLPGWEERFAALSDAILEVGP